MKNLADRHKQGS